MRCVVLLCDHSQNQWVIADLLVKAKADLDVISHKVHECDVQCLYGICTLMQALHATGTARHGIPMPHRLPVGRSTPCDETAPGDRTLR